MENYMPNYMPKGTKIDGRLYNVYFSIKTNGKLPDGISDRTLYRYTKILKSASIIKKISFGVWAINDRQKATEYEREVYSTLYAKNTDLPPSLTPKEVSQKGSYRASPVIDKRGHRIVQVITTPKLDLLKLKTYFNIKQRGYAKMIKAGRAGEYLQLWFGGALFQLYENKIVVRANKSFYSDLHITTENMALAKLGLIVETFEKNMPCSIRLGNQLHIETSGEFEHMNSDFAKWCYNRGYNLKFKAGKLRYWQDFSNGTANEEGNSARMMDGLGINFKLMMMYADIEGRPIIQDMVKDIIQLKTTQQQSFYTPDNIKNIKKKHKDLPSYFG